MSKGKVCKKCKIFVEDEKCPICGDSNFTETWKGKVIILNPETSEIAKRLKLEKEGAYAIKTG
ncbi:DNA-directed RNA polymerase subunit E'' [Candidatus Pacearchaeota archaeon CG06_land_8_20_14_3_00_35_12]|nr:MAG: DNA-directed RNA polymerase subunit E'' [Candidatus Pacearchaeota archaeon CG06_land_8_20_14_3_00_35_12]